MQALIQKGIKVVLVASPFILSRIEGLHGFRGLFLGTRLHRFDLSFVIRRTPLERRTLVLPVRQATENTLAKATFGIRLLSN